jgi:hypothetical protein
MLDEILKTPRGEKVVHGEARHSNRGSGAITPDQVRQAEEKIQRMLQAAATQKGRQKFSEVYPKLESSASTMGDSDDGGTPTPPKMKRFVRSVVNAQKAGSGGSPKDQTGGDGDQTGGGQGAAQHPPQPPLEPGARVYAKWWGADREKYPDWYEAEVHTVQGENSYTIKYQNGQCCPGVPRVDVRLRRTS